MKPQVTVNNQQKYTCMLEAQYLKVAYNILVFDQFWNIYYTES